MKIGSHNSWSYGEPKEWWMKPFFFVARCQKLDIKEQYERGVRLFDLRLRFDGHMAYVCHGLMKYEHDFMEDLRWLDEKGDVTVRVLLETSKPNMEQQVAFSWFCNRINQGFTRIRFFGGQRKFDWKKVYKGFGKDVGVVDRYSSTTSLFPSTWKGEFWRILDDWCPWIYAKLRNKKNLKEYADKDVILLMDFVE